jgi:hypothetical protein
MRYIPETVEGTTPTTGNGVNLRMTGETLDFNLTKDSSKEINQSRQIRALAITNAQAQGAINFEMVYKEYEPFLASLLMGTWAMYGTAGSSTAAITATFAPASGGHDLVTASAATTGNDAWTKLKKGDYVRIDAPTAGPALNAGNAGFFQLDADGTATVLSFATGSGIVAQAAAGIKVSSAKLQIGTTPSSFTLEKNFTDVGQFFSYNGMRVSKMDLSLSTGNFITGSFDFLGRHGERTQASVLPGSPVASQSGRSMSAVTGVPDVRLDGVPIYTTYSTYAKEITVSFDNQLEGLQALGTLGNVALMPKTIQLTGSLSLYLEPGATLPYDDFVNDVTHNFSFIVKDPDGNGYAFVFDQIDFSSMPVQATADGQAVMMDAKWTAIMGATSGNSLSIYRL